MGKILQVFVFIIFIFLFSIFSQASDKGKTSPLPREHIQKIKRISEFISEELTRRGIQTVTVVDFTDFKGSPSAKGSEMAKELKKQMTSLKGTKIKVVGDGAEAIVTGIVVPFRDSGKLKLDIKVVSPDKTKIITSYSAIFKKARKEKK